MKSLIASVAFATIAATPAFAHEEKGAPPKEEAKILALKDAPKHSGGTDANGCHTNHKTGDYHCHKPK